MKRALDLFLIIVGLPLLIPLYIIIAFIIKYKLGSPIFFRQLRPGYNEELFSIIKFRTMTNGFDKNGNFLPDHKRMSSFGNFLRSTSLDELPSLWNVFKGEMSLVGPRPLLVEYLDLYSPEQSKRHNIKPGLTGWAQVNGRNSLSWEEKFELDIWYLDNQTIRLDIKILFLTIKKVFLREGILKEGEILTPKFLGIKK